MARSMMTRGSPAFIMIYLFVRKLTLCGRELPFVPAELMMRQVLAGRYGPSGFGIITDSGFSSNFIPERVGNSRNSSDSALARGDAAESVVWFELVSCFLNFPATPGIFSLSQEGPNFRLMMCV